MRLLVALLVIGVVVYLITDRAPAPLARGTAENDARPATGQYAEDDDRPLRERSVANVQDPDGELTADNLKRRARAAADRLDDARVIAAIKAKFALDRDLGAGDIDVRCQNGMVTLTGYVATRDLAARAAKLAEDTEGVANVRSDLRVATTPPH